MWLIETGQKMKSIGELNTSEGIELTTMEFDDTNNKMFTASTDGRIKVIKDKIKSDAKRTRDYFETNKNILFRFGSSKSFNTENFSAQYYILIYSGVNRNQFYLILL